MPKGEHEFPGAAQCAADLAKLGVEAGYRSGLIAGLREAMLIADKHREERFRARDEAKALKSPKMARDHETMAIEAGHLMVSIRARITALEEEGKS